MLKLYVWFLFVYGCVYILKRIPFKKSNNYDYETISPFDKPLNHLSVCFLVCFLVFSIRCEKTWH